MEAAASSYSATGQLLQNIYSMLADNNHQKITSRCLAHEYSFTYIFNDINHGYKAALLKKNYLWLLSIYMNVASYCYYEKKRRTNAHSLNIFILFQLQSWIILRVRTKILSRNFYAKILETAMMNIFNNCIAGSLNNNYFPLNESSSLYWPCFVNSITAWRNTYLKNDSKTFNALILTPYSYTKQTTYCT